MSTNFSANAPEFFLHHAFLDFIWYRWQEKSTLCKQAYFPRKPCNLIDSPFKTIDFVDSFNQGNCVQVKYDNHLDQKFNDGDYIGEFCSCFFIAF